MSASNVTTTRQQNEAFDASINPGWLESTSEEYEHMLGCLPPERWIGGAFLVGEAYGTSPSGDYTYQAYNCIGGRWEDDSNFYKSARPMTIAEFVAYFREVR